MNISPDSITEAYVRNLSQAHSLLTARGRPKWKKQLKKKMDKPSEMEEESEKGTSSTPTVDEMYHQMYEERSRIKKNDQSLFSDALLSRIKLLSVLSYVICDI